MPVLYQFTFIRGNEHSTLGKKDGEFRSWNIKGIWQIMDLYVDRVLLSFDQLCQRYEIPKTHFFTFKKLYVIKIWPGNVCTTFINTWGNNSCKIRREGPRIQILQHNGCI